MAPWSSSVPALGLTGLTNLSSSRHRPPSLASREPGWTESWGGLDPTPDDDDDRDDGEGDYEDRPPPATATTTMVRLTQHRVAWMEQLVLRACRVPHVVVNSPYAAAESTGGLPFLLDPSSSKSSSSSSSRVRRRPKGEDGGGPSEGRDDADDDGFERWGDAWEESLSRLDKPVLVGRNQPGGMGSNFFSFSRDANGDGDRDAAPFPFLPSGSHVVDYLRLKYARRLGESLPFPEHLRDGRARGDAAAYEALIRERLDYVLLALRYGDDPAWEGTHRPRCVEATLDPNGAGSRRRRHFFPLWAWYQAFSERALALHDLLPRTHASLSASTHGVLALELFRYNDYRCPGPSESSRSSDDEGDAEESKEEEDVHQHHPLSSFFPSYGGTGGGDSGRVNARRALEVADACYAALEERLASSGEEAAFLLGTTTPTYVDALLFAHVVEALGDANLVPVLAGRTRLTRHFERMRDRYFGEGYAAEWASRPEESDWIRENDAANARNAFHRIPGEAGGGGGPGPFSEAGGAGSAVGEGRDVALAVRRIHRRDLDEALRDDVALRRAGGGEEALLEGRGRPMGSRLYRWFVGDEVRLWGSTSGAAKSSDAADDDDDDANSRSDGEERAETVPDEEEERRRLLKERMKKMERDRRSQDELWLSGVIVTVVVALFVSASGKKKQ